MLNGWRAVWQAFVTAGLPLRSEANEILHALLFGGDAILAGSDAGRPNSLLDDVQDLYAFFSGRTEDPPATNIAGDITTLALDRPGRLSDLLDEIVKDISNGGTGTAGGVRAHSASAATAHTLSRSKYPALGHFPIAYLGSFLGTTPDSQGYVAIDRLAPVE